METLEDDTDIDFLNHHLDLFNNYYDLIGLEALHQISLIIETIVGQMISKKTTRLFDNIYEFKLIL